LLSLGAPSLDPVTNKRVSIGSSILLSCTSRGSPPDTFTWSKDGNSTALKQFATIADVHTPATAVFISTYLIIKATLNDDGIYQCTVANLIGSDSKAIRVNIFGKCVHKSSNTSRVPGYRYMKIARRKIPDRLVDFCKR